MNLCLFDLDDTLLPLDSDHAWGEFVIRLGWVDEAEFRRRNDAFYAQYKAGQLDIHAYIAFAPEPLRVRGPQQAEEARHKRRIGLGFILPSLNIGAMLLAGRLVFERVYLEVGAIGGKPGELLRGDARRAREVASAG